MHTYSFFCAWIKHRCIVFNALLPTSYNSLFICTGTQVFPMLDWHTPIYGSPFKSIAFDLWTFPIDSYVQIVLKYGLLSCSFSDIFWHWLILCKWMFTPDLCDWMAYCTSLIPWFWTFSWLCASNVCTPFRQPYAFCAKINIFLQSSITEDNAYMWLPMAFQVQYLDFYICFIAYRAL